MAALKEILKINPYAQELWETLERFPKIPEDAKYGIMERIFVEIPNMSFFQPDGCPNKEWVISYGNTWDASWREAPCETRPASRGPAYAAAHDAGLNAAYDASCSALWGALWRAAFDTTLRVARDAAWRIAQDTPLEATLDAPWEAARDAALELALYCCLMSMSDLGFRFNDMEKHLEHVRARREVLQKGYGLRGDRDGVLSAYAPTPVSLRREGPD